MKIAGYTGKWQGGHISCCLYPVHLVQSFVLHILMPAQLLPVFLLLAIPPRLCALRERNGCWLFFGFDFVGLFELAQLGPCLIV